MTSPFKLPQRDTVSRLLTRPGMDAVAEDLALARRARMDRDRFTGSEPYTPPLEGWALAKDIGQGALSAGRTGLESILGGSGDIGDLLQSSGAFDMPGISSNIVKLMALMPTTEDVSAGTDELVNLLPESVSQPVQEVTRYEPQSPLGQAAGFGAEAATSLIGGPETLFAHAGPALASVGLGVAKRGKLVEKLLANAPGTVGLKADEALTGGRIAQRYPSGTKPTAGTPEENLLINMEVLQHDPKKAAQADAAIADYPNVTAEMKEMSAPERINALRDQMTRNLLHLYEMMPQGARDRASQWYLGANKIAEAAAQKYGISPQSTAGVFASMSPQKDWFQNVYQGNRLLDILDLDPKVTSDMLAKARTMDVFTKDPEVLRQIEALAGRRLSNLTPEEQAMMLRLYDETANPTQTYQKVSPEGELGDIQTTKSGRPHINVWQNFANIAKAIKSAGTDDLAEISKLMGYKHKVRNFYNNIVAPRLGEKFGDITADTHQVAASLFRPLGGSSPEVSHALGSYPGRGIPAAPQSAGTGLEGLYPIYADATRRAAALRDIPVRAMQSIPWEAVRSLFENKSGKMQAAVDQIWREHGAGNITEDEVRRRIEEAAGGFKVPTW